MEYLIAYKQRILNDFRFADEVELISNSPELFVIMLDNLSREVFKIGVKLNRSLMQVIFNSNSLKTTIGGWPSGVMVKAMES